MTEYVVQVLNSKRGNWEDDASSFNRDEAFNLLRETRKELGPGTSRLITRRI